MFLSVHQGSAPNYCASGSCYLCRCSPVGNWVKTGIDITGEGEFVVCEACIAEMARMLRYATPSQADKLRESNRTLGAENKRLKGAEAAVKLFITKLEEAREEAGV